MKWPQTLRAVDYTAHHIYSAYRSWRSRYYDYKDSDDEVSHFLDPQISSYQSGILQRTRRALLISTHEMAHRLEISPSSYVRLESSEAAGTIQLSRLIQAATAMDCEVICAIRPKKQLLFSEIIWEPLVAEALKHPSLSRPKPVFVIPRALAAIARRKFYDPEFRRRQKWVLNRAPHEALQWQG